ncbi:hypothetical protein BLOT_003134 [Blomia tropicalis]|nr:hypothetical protein BLOT_003134 [Blomia tropicalis]
MEEKMSTCRKLKVDLDMYDQLTLSFPNRKSNHGDRGSDSRYRRKKSPIRIRQAKPNAAVGGHR